MKEILLYVSEPDLIHQYIKKGYKVVSVGYFPDNDNPVYHFTFKKKPTKK